MKIGKLVALLVFLIGPFLTLGQASLSKKLIIKYDSLIGIENIGLINGTPHFVDFRSKNSHPFFESINWQEGEIRLRDQVYPNVRIKYDTYKQVLVLGVEKQEGRLTPVQLQGMGISSFQIGPSVFKNIQNESPPVGNSFYEILYEGKELSLLAKRIKSDEVNEKTLSVEFKENDKLYLHLNGVLTEFKRRGTFYSLFPKQKNSIKSYIKENKLKVNDKSLDHLIKLASYCDQF